MARKDSRKKSKVDKPTRSSKRNRARATTSSKNFDEMLTEAESLAREGIYAESCAAKPKHEGPPFPLLDLPPELRMNIFDYVVFRPYPLHLGDIVAPLITAISKQVRAECMARFFALNTFQMIVETNICLLEHINWFCMRFGSLRAALQQPHLHPNKLYWLRLIYRREAKAGEIQIRAHTENWLEKIHRDVAVFRNIDVVLHDTVAHPACAPNRGAPALMQLAWIVRALSHKEVFTVSVYHPMHLVPHFIDWHLARRYWRAQDYHDLPVREFIDLLNSDHPAFHNFNLDGLRTLAYAVGHWGDDY